MLSVAADVSLQDWTVRIDAPVAQERPVAARVFDEGRIAPGDQNFLAFARFGDIASEGIGDERVAEEGDAVGAGLILMADAVRRRHVYTVCNRVATLDRTPRVYLSTPPFVLFRRMPADSRGIEEYLRPHQRRDACGLGEPLVPADQDADGRIPRLPTLESNGIARLLTLV